MKRSASHGNVHVRSSNVVTIISKLQQNRDSSKIMQPINRDRKTIKFGKGRLLEAEYKTDATKLAESILESLKYGSGLLDLRTKKQKNSGSPTSKGYATISQTPSSRFDLY